MKKGVVITIVIGLAAVSLFLYLNTKGNKILELHDVMSTSMGMSTDDFTFEEVMTKTDQVVVGKVIGTEKLNGTKDVFSVLVEQQVLGDVPEKILVYSHTDLMKEAETYVFFLQPFISTVYDKDFYTTHPEFIIRVDENNQLERVSNTLENTAVQPFVKAEYNQLDHFKTFIQKHYKTPKTKNIVLPEPKNTEELLKHSDYVFEITIHDLDDDEGIASVDFSLVKEYKGSKAEFALLLPTNQIEENKNYLIFLKENDGSVELTSRKGSIIEVAGPEYSKVISSIE